MRCVFLGTGGFLGRVDGDTRCAFWADEPTDHAFDPARLISIDLSLTPNAAAAGQISWDAVQVDDCFSGPNGALGGTTLGTRWPELQLSGAVYLEREFWRALPELLRPPCPPNGMTGRVHEYMTVVYWPGTSDPRAGKRYVGHHAEILETRGTLSRVAVFPPGSSERPNAKPLVMWIDLASAEQCDAGRDAMTELGPETKQGALFLISSNLTSTTEGTT